VAAELTNFRRNRFVHDAKGLTIEDLSLSRYTGDATLTGFKDDASRRRSSRPSARGRGTTAVEALHGLRLDVSVSKSAGLGGRRARR
jgi:hypothetical protein